MYIILSNNEKGLSNMWSIAEGIIKETEERVRQEITASVLGAAGRWTGLIFKRIREQNLELTEDNIRNIGKQENIPDLFIDQMIATLKTT